MITRIIILIIKRIVVIQIFPVASLVFSKKIKRNDKGNRGRVREKERDGEERRKMEGSEGGRLRVGVRKSGNP